MEVSNPDKLIFPQAGLTKADLVGHYERVGREDARLPGRSTSHPATFPERHLRQGFYAEERRRVFPGHHRPAARSPSAVGGVTNYPVVERAEDLAYLANQGTVTFHMWTSTAALPGVPDWMVIDLDPVEGDLDGVRFATRVIRELLADFDVVGFPLATGSKGFHVWVPVGGGLGFNDVSTAARALGGLAAHRHPEQLTTEFLKKNRKGRVFVDWLRNGPAATVVAPFSLRPRPTAPVAAPLRWSELTDFAPDRWTLTELGDRLDLDAAVGPQTIPVGPICAAARQAGVDLDTPHDRFGRGG